MYDGGIGEMQQTADELTAVIRGSANIMRDSVLSVPTV
jgi:hypothetical protein